MKDNLRQELKKAWRDPVQATILQRRIQEEKRLLRDWYHGIYCFMRDHLARGTRNVEIGSGSSFLRKYIPGLITSNVLSIPDNSMTFDACEMPFEDNSVDNLVLISVYHHLADPGRFLAEAQRVLTPGGRVLISDPYLSVLSYPVWRFLHPEHCDISRTGFPTSADAKNPLCDANSANATLMFVLHPESWRSQAPRLHAKQVLFHTVMLYWLAGGYNLPPLAPAFLLPVISRMERLLRPFGRYLSSFVYVVLEKEALQSR